MYVNTTDMIRITHLPTKIVFNVKMRGSTHKRRNLLQDAEIKIVWTWNKKEEKSKELQTKTDIDGVINWSYVRNLPISTDAEQG